MNNQAENLSQDSQENEQNAVQSDYRVGQATGKPVTKHAKQTSMKVQDDLVEGDADNDIIVESDFSEINQYGDDDHDSNEEEYYEQGLPSQSVNGNETPRDIQFKLENYSDDGRRSAASSDLVVNLDPAQEKEFTIRQVSNTNTPRQKEQLNIQERKPLHSPSPRQETKTTTNREGGQKETSPASICPSPVEPTRKPAQKMSAAPVPVNRAQPSDSPSKYTTVIKATEMPRQQPLQSQPPGGGSLLHTGPASTVALPQHHDPFPSQSPLLNQQHSLAIPQTVAGRMSLKDKMKAEQAMTPEQIAMERHLSHVSNEYRRSQLRNQRQQVMEQFIRAEKNLSVIQQLEERSSNDGDSQTAHSGRHDDSDSQVFSESGQAGSNAATLAKKNKSAFIIAKKQSHEKQREGAVKSRQRVLTKTDKKGGRKEEENKKMKKRLIFNTYNTNYPIIDLAAKNLGFKTVFKDHNLVPSPELKAAHRIAPGVYATIIPEEFDVVWFDTPIKEDTLQKIKPHQRVSQWPGIQIITNKSRLAKNLTLMKKSFPMEYNFSPMSYNLPNDLNEFKKALIHQRDVYIVKPSHDCQGRGIYLAGSIDDYQEDSEGKPQVAQTYIDNPLLIDSLKFDLRLYVLLFGIQPLRIYLFDDGLARFATTPYQSALRGDKKNLFMHLTNYAINKKNENYVQNENFDGGTGTTLDGSRAKRDNSSNNGQGEPEEQPEAKKAHKRSLKQIYKLIEEMGRSTGKLKQDIKELVIKTLITGQSHLHHIFKTNHPDDFENQMCFQILGFDVMIDSNLKPWLIEVNQSPSFATDSAFDFTLKKKLMEDTFQLLNLTPERRSQYMEQREKYYIERLMTANKGPKMSFEEKEQRRLEVDNKRDKEDRKLLRNSAFELIFPYKEDEHKIHQYNLFLSKSREIQEAFIHGKRNLMKDKSVYDLILESVQNNNRVALTPNQLPDKFMNKRDRPKSAIEKNIIGGIQNQKRPAKKDDDQLQRRKKDMDFDGMNNMLENIRSQKDEQKNKDKTQKKKIARDVKQKQMNANVLFDKDLSAQVDQLIHAQHMREKEQREKLNSRQPPEIESKPVMASEPAKDSAKSTNYQAAQISNYQKLLTANKDLKNPYTQIQRSTISQIETQPTKSSPWPSMLRKDDDRSKTPLTNKLQQQQSNFHKKTKSIARQESYIQHSEKMKTIDVSGTTNDNKASTLPKRYQPPSINLWKDQQTSNLDNSKGSAKTPRLPSPKQNNYLNSPKQKGGDLAGQNDNGSKSQVIRQRGTSTMNVGTRSQLNFTNNKSDFSFRNEYISNNKELGTKSTISISVVNPREGNPNKDRSQRDKRSPRDAAKDKTEKSANSHVTAQGREKSTNVAPRRDRSENTKDYQEYSVPPPVRAPTYNPKQQKQNFLSKFVPFNQKHNLEPVKLSQVKEPERTVLNLKNAATPVLKNQTLSQNPGGQKASPPGISIPSIPGLKMVPTSSTYGKKKRSNSLENLGDPDEEKSASTVDQPHSAGFSTVKPSLGKSMRSKNQSPRNLKKQLFGTSQPPQFTPDANDTQYKDIIDKIEEKDQKELSKMKSDSKRKRSEATQKKPSGYKFIIDDQPGSQNSTMKNQKIISGIENMIDIYDQDKKNQQSNSRPASFFEKVRLDTSNDGGYSKHSDRQNETVLNKNSFESHSNTVDFYQQELQKLQRVDKMLKKESKKQKKNSDHGFFSPQKKRKEKAESPRFTHTISSNVGGQSSTTANNLMQSTMSSKTNNDDLVIVRDDQEKSIQSQFNVLKSSTEASPSRYSYQNSSSIMTPHKNFMNKNKEGISKMSNQITDMKDAMLIQSPELPTSKKDSATTPQRGGKLIKKIPNQNRARDQFIQLIEVLKGEEKDPIFELDHDFKINQVIGKGTFAVIKKATHNQTGYQVALKTYQKKLLTKKSQLMAIHREIYILAGLNHPNIMKLFEVIDTPTHVNLIMQLCSGPNMLDYQNKRGEKVKFVNNKVWTHILPEERVKPIFKQLTNAINYMHNLGLVHRDLRIENIIINESTSEVKFIDFGFATSFQANKQLQMIGGTPQIKDPKVIKSKTLQCQLADVYSMGIILYILLTGGVPNWALIESDLYATVHSEKNQLPIREDSLTGQWYEIFSQPLSQLFQKMITCDADNPVSMEDILNDPWLAGEEQISAKSVN